MKNFKIRLVLVVLLSFTVFYAYTKGQVRLKDEYVRIRVDRNFNVHVEIEFIFENTKGYSALLAFPGSDWFSYNNFSAIWNGSILKTAYKQAPEGQYYEINKDRYSSIITFQVPDTASPVSKHVIRYSYSAPYVKFDKDYESEGYYIEYILRTGALWKGTVSNLNVRIETDTGMSCRKIKYLNSSFKGKCISDNVLEIKLKDTVLDKDIRLLYEKR